MLLGLPVAGLLVVSSVGAPLPTLGPEEARSPSSAADLEAEALYNAGVERFEAGEFEAALTPLEASLELLDDPNTRYAYAQTLNKLGRCPEAVREYERIIALVPEGSDVHAVLSEAVRACATQMADALAEADAAAAEPEPPPVVLRLQPAKPVAFGDDPGASWRVGGIAAMVTGGVSVVVGGGLAIYFAGRRQDFASQLGSALESRGTLDCDERLGDLACEQNDSDVDTLRRNANTADRAALTSALVGVGVGVSLLVGGGLAFREGDRRTRTWRSGRPLGLVVPTLNGAALVGQF